MSLTYASIWIDHAKLGCGWRRVIFFAEGRKWVSLCDPFSATIVHLTRKEASALKVIPISRPKWRRLRRSLKERLQFIEATKQHKELLQALKEERTP